MRWILVLFAVVAYTPVAMAQEPDVVRIVYPQAGFHSKRPESKVVVEGPPGATVRVTVDGETVVEKVVDDDGRIEHAPVHFGLESQVGAELIGRDAPRASVWFTAPPPKIRRGVDTMPFAVAAACAASTVFAVVIVPFELKGDNTEDINEDEAWLSAAIGTTLGPIAATGCLYNVERNPGDLWAAYLGSATVASIFLLLAQTQPDVENRNTLIATAGLMSWSGALLGLYLSVRYGDDWTGLSVGDDF